MLKKIFFLSLIFILCGSVLLEVEVFAFEEEIEEELEEEEAEQTKQQTVNMQAVSEIQMLDVGLPWIGGRAEFPAKIDIPGRKIEPDYIVLEGLFKLGKYQDESAFQGRGSFKYDVGDDMYTQFGVGYLNVGGFGGLTGVAKTGIEIPLGGLELDAGIVGQRTLLGAIVNQYDNTLLLGVNVGIGF